MQIRYSIRTAIALLAVTALGACDAGLPQDVTGPVLKKGGNKPPGDPPLAPDIPLDITLTSFGAGTIGNDDHLNDPPLGDYKDGFEGVSAFVFQGDHLSVDIDPVGKGKNATVKRRICFDFSEPVDIPGFEETGSLPFTQLCEDPLWNTSDQRDADGNSATLSSGNVVSADSRFIIGLPDGEQLKVRFGNKESEANPTCPPLDESTSRLVVTTINGGWELTADATTVATVTRAPRNKGFIECIGRYQMSWTAMLRVSQP